MSVGRQSEGDLDTGRRSVRFLSTVTASTDSKGLTAMDE
jgi:hypothetical protein